MVDAHARGPAAVDVVTARARGLDHVAERHVVGGLEAQVLEAGRAVKRAAAHEREAAAAHRNVGRRVAYGVGTRCHRHDADEDGPEQVDESAAAAELRDEREQIEALGLAVRDRPPEHARHKLDVGVGEQQPLTGRNLDAVVHRVHLAEPAVRQVVDAHDLQALVACREPREDLRRLILRAVVDDDEFEVRVPVVEPRGQRRREVGGLVARRDDRAHLRPARRVGWRESSEIADLREVAQHERALHEPHAGEGCDDDGKYGQWTTPDEGQGDGASCKDGIGAKKHADKPRAC